jgi:hypothetical protein
VVILFVLLVSFLLFRRNMMLVILLLEITGFFVMFFVSERFSQIAQRDFFLLVFFSVLVMEGVIALSGLIGLVRSSGGDYVSVSSILK